MNKTLEIKVKRNEENKIIDVLVNGKPVKRGFMRGLRKAQKTSYWHEYTTKGKAQNPFTKVWVELSPLEWSIATWCQTWYYCDYAQNPSKTQAPIQAYDDMKYFLLELNSNAYYELLD